jgi:hypothetical protein
MLKMVLIAVSGMVIICCTPKEAYRVQTFSPVMIDMAKIDNKNYEELIGAVNAGYAPETKEFVDARFFREEKMFMYFHVYSGKNSGCYRVTVDRNRSRIVNMQPDCAIDDE